MAPTICLSELSVQNNRENVHIRRRQRNLNTNGVIRMEHQRLELRQIIKNPTNDRDGFLSPAVSQVWEPTYPTSSFSPNKDSASKTSLNGTSISASDGCSQDWRSILARRKGLLDIVARTMALVRRSHMLQKRVNALRYETREFIRSVLNNPENVNGGKEFEVVKENVCGYIGTDVSSSSEVLAKSRSIATPQTPDSSTSDSNSSPIYGYDDRIDIDTETDSRVLSDADPSYSSFSNSDYSSDESDHYITTRKLTQDPMISSS